MAATWYWCRCSEVQGKQLLLRPSALEGFADVWRGHFKQDYMCLQGKSQVVSLQDLWCAAAPRVQSQARVQEYLQTMVGLLTGQVPCMQSSYVGTYPRSVACSNGTSWMLVLPNLMIKFACSNAPAWLVVILLNSAEALDGLGKLKLVYGHLGIAIDNPATALMGLHLLLSSTSCRAVDNP